MKPAWFAPVYGVTSATVAAVRGAAQWIVSLTVCDTSGEDLRARAAPGRVGPAHGSSHPLPLVRGPLRFGGLQCAVWY